MQLWHWTVRFSASQPRASSGSSRSAFARSFSTSAPDCASTVNGAEVPQNGQTSSCFDGFHSACAPHAAQGCFSRAAISGIWGQISIFSYVYDDVLNLQDDFVIVARRNEKIEI